MVQHTGSHDGAPLGERHMTDKVTLALQLTPSEYTVLCDTLDAKRRDYLTLSDDSSYGFVARNRAMENCKVMGKVLRQLGRE